MGIDQDNGASTDFIAEEVTSPFTELTAAAQEARCMLCSDFYAKANGLCTWCAAFRSTARYVTAEVIQRVLDEKRQGLL